MKYNNLNFQKRLQRGRFFILLFAVFSLVTFISFAHTEAYRIQLLSRSDGFSGLKAVENGLLAWNMFSGNLQFSKEGKKFEYNVYHPIDVFPLSQKKAVVVQYLNHCASVLDLEEGSQKERCLRDDKWIPAAFCRCGGTTLMVAFRTVAKNGVEKNFPYYVPVINRFDYAVIQADDFLKAGQKGKIFSKRTFSDYWHEESAGIWKMECAGKSSVLLLNPTGEKLVRVDYEKGNILWESKTGKKPLALVLDPDRKRAYVGSAQEEYIEVFGVERGKSIEKIKVGKGLNKLIWAGDALFGVDPYSRKILKIDLETKKYDYRVFTDFIPVDIVARQNILVLADGKSRNVVRMDLSLNWIESTDL